MTPDKKKKRLILLGGGHTHALLLRMHLMNPLDYDIIIISESPVSYYSGMLPGFMAGYYTEDEISIELQKLCSLTKTKLITATITGINRETKEIFFKGHPSLNYDLLSINTGSIPNVTGIQGAKNKIAPGIGIKPLIKFIPYFNSLLSFDSELLKKQEMAIIGGGAAGIETALALNRRFNCKVHLFNRDRNLFKEGSSAASAKLIKYLHTRNVQLHFGTVESISKNKKQTNIHLVAYTVTIVQLHFLPVVIYLTEASPPDWIKASGLQTDTKGFILTNNYLKSVSDDSIFVCGDSGTIASDPRSKAGVYAVRQTKYLYTNLKNFSTGKTLQYRPQKHFLILIGTSDGKGFASKERLFIGPQKWIWRWKRHIDTKFMQLFHNISMEDSLDEMRCLGCGAKIGETVLKKVLHKMQQEDSQIAYLKNNPRTANIIKPFSDDSAVITPKRNHLLLQTVDFFPLLNLDVYTAGKICANHCLNDIYAMGGVPEYALAILSLPQSKFLEETMFHLLTGINETLKNNRVQLVGGHTAEGQQISAGLAVTGSIKKIHMYKKEISGTGYNLILTKPLGTGTLFAAEMRGKAKGKWLQRAVTSMLQSNWRAVEIFRKYKINACTDITGFGLAGHLLEMLAGGFSAEIILNSIPLLEGALECINNGIYSSLQTENESNLSFLTFDKNMENSIRIFFDPQTAGGLLVAIPHDETNSCLAELNQNGYHAANIGKIVKKSKIKNINII